MNKEIRDEIDRWYLKNTYWLTQSGGHIYTSAPETKHYLGCPRFLDHPLADQVALKWHNFCFANNSTIPSSGGNGMQNLVIDFKAELGDHEEYFDDLWELFMKPYRIWLMKRDFFSFFFKSSAKPVTTFPNNLRKVEFIFRTRGQPGCLDVDKLLNNWGQVWLNNTTGGTLDINATVANEYSSYFRPEDERSMQVVVLDGNKVAKSMVFNHSTDTSDPSFWEFDQTPEEMEELATQSTSKELEWIENLVDESKWRESERSYKEIVLDLCARLFGYGTYRQLAPFRHFIILEILLAVAFAYGTYLFLDALLREESVENFLVQSGIRWELVESARGWFPCNSLFEECYSLHPWARYTTRLA